MICVYWLSVKKEARKPRIMAYAKPFSIAKLAIYMVIK